MGQYLKSNRRDSWDFWNFFVAAFPDSGLFSL